MNSINSQAKGDIHSGIRNFFEHELMPLAEKIKKQQDIIPWVGMDSGATSYYKARKKTRMVKQDFEIGGHSSLETFAADLTTFWKSNGDSDFCDLVPSLTLLAKELHVDEDQNVEISPYVYVMF